MRVHRALLGVLDSMHNALTLIAALTTLAVIRVELGEARLRHLATHVHLRLALLRAARRETSLLALSVLVELPPYGRAAQALEESLVHALTT